MDVVPNHTIDHGEEDARSENGSGEKAIGEADGRQGAHCDAPGRPSHHEDLRPPLGIVGTGEKHR